MKQILFLLLCLILNSCACENTPTKAQARPIITDVSRLDKIFAKYKIDNGIDHYEYDFGWFVDSIGKFDVGDTLKIIK